MSNEVKKTSQEWYEEICSSEISIMDPDGWDRRNFRYSWYEEEITKSEFIRRIIHSTLDYVSEKGKAILKGEGYE